MRIMRVFQYMCPCKRHSPPQKQIQTIHEFDLAFHMSCRWTAWQPLGHALSAQIWKLAALTQKSRGRLVI